MQYANMVGHQGQKVTVFPQIQSLQQFKHHLHLTLTKFQEQGMVFKAHEEMRDLMTEHITNSDRMNAFLGALAHDNKYNANKNQRKEIIKLYGIASEIFEESLATFVQKILMYLQKILKENQEYTQSSVAWSLGKVVANITSKLSNLDDKVAQVDSVLQILFQNMQVPNVLLQ